MRRPTWIPLAFATMIGGNVAAYAIDTDRWWNLGVAAFIFCLYLSLLADR